MNIILSFYSFKMFHTQKILPKNNPSHTEYFAPTIPNMVSILLYPFKQTQFLGHRNSLSYLDENQLFWRIDLIFKLKAYISAHLSFSRLFESFINRCGDQHDEQWQFKWKTKNLELKESIYRTRDFWNIKWF